MHVKVAGIYFRLVEVAVLQYSRGGFAFSGVAASPIVHVEEAYRGRSQAKNVNCHHVWVFREGLVGRDLQVQSVLPRVCHSLPLVGPSTAGSVTGC